MTDTLESRLVTNPQTTMINVVVYLGGEYYSLYPVKTGLTISDDNQILDVPKISGINFDLRSVTTPIGTFTFDLDDTIAAKMLNTSGNWLQTECTLWMGDAINSDWLYYTKMISGIVVDITAKTNKFSFNCKEILDVIFKDFVRKTSLTADIITTTNVIPLADTSLFQTAGVIVIDTEFIGYTGKTATTLTGATRGIFTSIAANHSKETFAYSDYHFFNINPITIMLQLLLSKTGNSSNSIYDVLQFGLGIDKILLDIVSFEAIRTEWFPTATFVLEVYDTGNLLNFLEQEILQPLNCRLVTVNGKITLTLLDNYTSDPVFPRLDEDIIIGVPNWKIESNKIINTVEVFYAYDFPKKLFTTKKVYRDNASIALYGVKGPFKFEFKGILNDAAGNTLIDRLIEKFLLRMSRSRGSIQAKTFYNAYNIAIGANVLLSHRYVPQTGYGMGISSILEVISKSIDLGSGNVQFNLEFMSTAEFRTARIAPAVDIVTEISKSKFIVDRVSLFKVGHRVELMRTGVDTISSINTAMISNYEPFDYFVSSSFVTADDIIAYWPPSYFSWTGDNSPSPARIWSSIPTATAPGGFELYKILDGSGSTSWKSLPYSSGTWSVPFTIEFFFGFGVRIYNRADSYSFKVRYFTASNYNFPNSFTLHASNDGITYDLLDTRTNVVWVDDGFTNFSIATQSKNYSRFKLTFTGFTTAPVAANYMMFTGFSLWGANQYPTNTFLAFDKNISNIYTTQYPFSSGDFISYKSKTSYQVSAYKIHRGNAPITELPKSFSFSASLDGVTWTTLNTQSNIAWATLDTEKIFTFTKTATSYYFFKLTVTAITGGVDDYLSIAYLEIFDNYDLAGNSYLPDAYKTITSIVGNEITVDAPFTSSLAGTKLKLARYDNATVVMKRDFGYIAGYGFLDITPVMTSDSAPAGYLVESSSAYNKINPTMTSNTLPSGYIASASSEYWSGTAAWYVFDTIPTDLTGAGLWMSGNTAFPHFLKIKLPVAKIAKKYSVGNVPINSADAGEVPKNWIFQGSNNDSTWVDLHTATNQVWAVTGIYDEREFIFTNTTAYLYYRIYISANNGSGTNYCRMWELKIYEAITTSFQAYDNIPATHWETISTTSLSIPQWSKVTFPSAISITKYSIRNKTGTDVYSPKTWNIEGSNNGTTWTLIDARTNETNNASGALREFTLSSASPNYLYLRIFVTASNGGAVSGTFQTAIAELKYYKTTTLNFSDGSPPYNIIY